MAVNTPAKNNRNKTGLLILAIWLSVLSGVFASSEKPPPDQDISPKTIVHRFFTLVYQREYEKAYNCFSRSIQKEVSISRFRDGAGNIRFLKILEILVSDREKNLVKMKIKALLHIVYKGELYEAVYEGKVDVYLEGQNWKIMTVDLSATSQKPLGKPADPEQLQKLDFGTTR